MKSSGRQPAFPSFETLSRLLWAILLLIHAPALISAWRALIGSGWDITHLGGCAGLLAACVFFVLKCYGARFLRFHTDRASCVSIFAALVLIHADVLGGGSRGVIAPKYDPIIASALLLGNLAPARRALRTIAAGLGNSARQRPLADCTRGARGDESRPVRLCLTHPILIPRAPPA